MKKIIIAMGVLPLVTMAGAFVDLAKGREVLCVNGDNDHYFKKSCMRQFLPMDERWSEEGAKKYLDIVTAGGKVTHLFMCPVGQRADWNAKSCDPIWLAIEEAKARGEEPDEWPLNAKKCFDNGVDVYQVWCREARKRGNVSLWISMRMNDIHHVEREWNMRTNKFWYEHPELHRDPNAPRKYGMLHALDYAKKEVQDFEFGIFKELVDRYDADGYELDWMRFWVHLTPGRERELSYVLTDFMRRCRNYAKSKEAERGHPIYLSTRVPSSYEAARRLGMDPETWAREGLVEMIAVANFWASIDFDCDMPAWVARLKKANPNVAVLASACDNVCAGPGAPVMGAPAEVWRGWAHNARAEGADGVYFFNVAYKSNDLQREIYDIGFAAERIANAPRRYVSTYHDCTRTRDDEKETRELNGAQLPENLKSGAQITVNVGGVAQRGDMVDVTIIVNRNQPCPEVKLNGVKPSAVAMEDKQITYARYGLRDKTKATDWRAWKLPFPNTALKKGHNVVSIGKAACTLMWTEISVNWK